MPKIAPEVQQAIDAFRDAERTRFLFDRKNRDHNSAVRIMARACSETEREIYFTETEKIAAEYDQKRAKEGL